MLQIRLHKVPSSDGGGGAKALSLDAVTVACPDHLVLADLPVAKSIGSVTAASLVKTVGRRSRRQLGERVHICVSCDVPIAIYGRLSPCEHVFCLDCARSDSICYLCDERIQKIQTIKMMEGIFICAAPHCLKSFLKKTEFETHIQQAHNELLQLNLEREGNDSEPVSAKKPSASDSTVQAPPKPVFSPNSNSQAYDHEDKSHHRSQPPPPPLRPIMQPNLMPPFFGQMQNHPLEMPPVGFDRNAPQNQPPNFVMPVNSNPMMVPPLPFGYPPFQPEGSQPFFMTSPYEIPRPNLISSSEVGSEQGSLLGFPSGNMNFQEQPYPRPWLMGPAGAAFEGSPTVGQGTIEGSFPQMGDYGGNIQGGALVDGKGILAAQPFPQPPPPPMPHPQLAQVKRGGGEEQGFGWQRESSSFGRGQD